MDMLYAVNGTAVSMKLIRLYHVFGMKLIRLAHVFEILGQVSGSSASRKVG